MWEISSGMVAYSGQKYDYHSMAIRILDGLRPPIPKGIELCYINLLKSCWDSDPEKRPSASEIYETIENWKKDENIENWKNAENIKNWK